MVEQGSRGFERISLATEPGIEVPADRTRPVFLLLPCPAAEQIADDLTGLFEANRYAAIVEGAFADFGLRLGQVCQLQREEAGCGRRAQIGKEVFRIPLTEAPEDQALGFNDLHGRHSSKNGSMTRMGLAAIPGESEAHRDRQHRKPNPSASRNPSAVEPVSGTAKPTAMTSPLPGEML